MLIGLENYWGWDRYFMKKTNLILLIVFFLMVVVPLITPQELRVTLLTPSVTLETNESNPISHYLTLQNKNDFNIKIKIEPPKNLSIKFKDKLNFELEPKEIKYINYTIKPKITDAGTHLVNIIYSHNNQSFSLQSQINLIVHENKKNPISFYILFPLIFLALWLIIIFAEKFLKKMKGGTKSNEDNEIFNYDGNPNGYTTFDRSWSESTD